MPDQPALRPAAAELVVLAARLARLAGDLVHAGRGDAARQVDTKSTPTDVVTAVDRASEALLADELARVRPHDAVLGEEGAAREGTSGIRWVLDPIDGTVNFLYGIPWYAVSVAAEVDGVVQAGAVLNPELGELYTAVRGQGARLNGEPIHCTGVRELSQTLVGTGFGYDSDRRARQAAVMSRLLPRVRDVRRFGSAALDLCQVAVGHLDAHYERGLSYWDHAAGALIAAEAGARVTGLHGRAPGADCVVAAAPGIAAAFGALLDDLIPDDGSAV